MKKAKTLKPVKTHQVPVTVELLNEVRNELIHRIDSTKKSLKLEIVQSRDEFKSEIHSLRALIEEQNARNIYVLDGLSSLFNRQERLEAKVSS